MVMFLRSEGADSLGDLVRFSDAAKLIQAIGLKPVPARKALCFLSDLRDAAKATNTFSKKDRQDSGYKPPEDDVGRLTKTQFELYIKRLKEETLLVFGLAFHFTSKENLRMILEGGSLGLRASRQGQLAGGLYVCSTWPTKLGWEPFGGGQFRETVGKTLWGQKWQEVLPGGPHADKLEVLLVLQVPTSIINDEANRVPGREDIVCIPRALLFPNAGHHYYSRQHIVKVLHLTQ